MRLSPRRPPLVLHRCFKHATRAYAQCRPLVGTHCTEAGYWNPFADSPDEVLCPGWQYCEAADFGECTASRCCSSARHACMTRDASYAACIQAFEEEELIGAAVARYSPGPHMEPRHTVHLPLGALRVTCAVCGAGTPSTRTRSTPSRRRRSCMTR